MSSGEPIPPKPQHAPGAPPPGPPASGAQDAGAPASEAHTSGEVPLPAPAPGFSGTGPTHAAADGAHAGSGPAGAFGATRSSTRKQQKKSRLPLILSLSAVGVVLVLVVVGAITIMNVNRSQYGPDVIAQEYLDAVAAGDLDTAGGMAEATVPNGADTTLLTPEVAASAAETIESPQVGEPEIQGDSATMTASYTVDGQAYELPLTAQKSGRTGVFFDEWTLDPPVLQTISLDLLQSEGATINGTEMGLQPGETEYAVMPGTYEAAVPATRFTEEANATISLGFAEDPEPQPAALEIRIDTTDAYTEDVQAAVADMLEECTDSGQLETDCGFFSREAFSTESEREDFDTLRTEDVEYDLVEQPTIVVTDLALTATGSFYTEDDSPGKVEADVEDEDGNEYELEAELRPSGTVRIEDDSVVVEFLTNG